MHAVPTAQPGAAAFIFQGDAIRYVNPAAEVMTGYAREELLAMPFWGVIHPDDRALLRDRGLARQRGEVVPSHYELRLQRKDGTTLCVEFSEGLIEYDNQPAVLGTAIDATERRRTEQRLFESERRFRALSELGSDIVLITDRNGRIHYMGAAIERILGIPAEEFIGNNGFDLLHPDDRDRVIATYAVVAERPGGRAGVVYRIRHRDGSWRWLESIGTNLLDDPVVAGIIVNSRDVTDREEALSAYRAVVEHSLQGLLIVQDMRIVFANRTLAQVSGYSVEELLGFSPERLRELIHPDDRELVWQRPLRRLAGDPSPPRAELRFLRRDGAVRWIETYASVIEYRGRPAVQVAYVDISERKRAETDAQLRQQELAHVLRRRTMGEMAAVFAHEVNQPLTAIVSYAKGCAHRIGTGTAAPEQLVGALDEIAAQAVRAGEIIRRLRRFVRRGETQRQPAQLNDLVDDAVHFIAAEASERSVRLRVELATELPLLDLDAVQIEQVVLNLLRNALEAMYDSPGEQPQLTIHTRRADTAVELSVSDTGPGVPEDVADQMFEPFVSSKSEGLGMGLSICRSIIAAHDGRLWATANPDRGMTFTFALPIGPAPER